MWHRLGNTNSTRPDFIVVRAGTLDHSREISPRAHIWVASKQDWITLPADVPQFAQMEPLAEFLGALAAGA